MIEPLLSVSIPNEVASVRKHRQAGGAAETIVVVQQAFDNVRCQENIFELCRLFARQAGVRLVAVEGADGKVASGGRKSVRDHVRESSAVSAGVLALQHSHPGLVDVWGVDDMELNRQSHVAMAAVRQNAPVRDRAFAQLRPLLLEAQRRCYEPDIATLRRATLTLYGERAEIGRQSDLVKAAAEHHSLNLGRFPFLRRLHELREQERKISSWRARLQALKLVLRVRKRMYGWFRRTGRNVITIDMEKAKPVLEYWMEMTGITPEELDAKVEQRGLESTLRELKQWLDQRFLGESHRHARDATHHVFFEEMMRLALRLGVGYFDLRHIRQAIALHRDSGALKVSLLDEVEVASREVVRIAGPAEAIELMELEDQLDLFWRALDLAVTPGDAETAAIAAGRLAPLLDALERLARMPVPRSAELRRVDELLGDAATFLRLSRQRSQHMAQRTLALMRERGDDRALLVTGGFHERAITRELEDRRRVSWSVLLPGLDLEEVRP